ncbi:MAG: metallophosphoesterase [Nanoarchaeota archaeon]|nr:metallophosphoesterase [Nanoarchaeota archaeon]
MEKTKILALADIHGDSALAKKAAKKASKEKVDMVIIAGDLTWFGQPAKEIVSPFLKNKIPVLTMPGNHDPESISQELSQVYKGIVDIHKKNFEHRGIGFFGTGTTDWGFYEDGKQVYSELQKAHKKIQSLKKKVMISHSPPEGSKIELLGYPGSRAVTEAIKKFNPDFLICGHIHEGGGLIEKIGNTTVINSARKPIIFEI